MSSQAPLPPDAWNEQNSQAFIDYGRYFVPERERQWQMMADLIPKTGQPGSVIDLCCGEGLTAELILEQHPQCTLYGLDGSEMMLQRAGGRLARFGERFIARRFDLLARSWLEFRPPLLAVISSLVVHHLDGAQKQALDREVYSLLAPGGAWIIADMIAPAHPSGWEVAARAWDEVVRERALALDGNRAGLIFFDEQHWNTYRYFDPQDIDKPSPLFDQLKWLEQAGFVNVDVYWMKAGHALFAGFK